MENDKIYPKPRSGGANTITADICIWCLCGYNYICSDGGDGETPDIVTCPDCGQKFRVYDPKIEAIDDEGNVVQE